MAEAVAVIVGEAIGVTVFATAETGFIKLKPIAITSNIENSFLIGISYFESMRIIAYISLKISKMQKYILNIGYAQAYN